MTSDFSTQILDWYRQHGRKNLPWQKDRDPYKIWLSEIMLQQTQVATVIPYFERFVHRFPTFDTLAAGGIDEVMHLWTGLGYYARARNLHRAARRICEENGGRFPSSATQACDLPGIGRSTAHAILAFAFDYPLPILDGNVKRVLTRFHRLHGWPGRKDIDRRLWQLSASATPAEHTAEYTQAIMDLGATVCVRRKPLCETCPLTDACQARAHGEQNLLPTPIPRKDKPVRAVTMVMMQKDRCVLLERRPPSGIWGGLWSFPELESELGPDREISARFGLSIAPAERWPAVRHSFTHFHLDITPLPATVLQVCDRVLENPGLVWYNLIQPEALGLAAPVKKLLDKLG